MVAGVRDLDETARFLAVFGLRESDRSEVPADLARALYGVDRVLAQREMAADGVERGRVVLVTTERMADRAGPYARGPLAVDIYTRDIEQSLSLVDGAGHQHGPVGTVELGELVLRQCLVRGPSALNIGLVQASRRRPSLLDADDERLHSEVGSVVWSVDDVAASIAAWRDAGLTALGPYPVMHPEVSAFMELPRPDVPITMGMLCDASMSAVRIEPLTFTADTGADPHDGRALRSGVHALRFHVADLDAAMASVAGASYGDVVAAPVPCVAGRARDGIRFQLWQHH